MQFQFSAVHDDGTVMQASLAREGLRVTLDQTNGISFAMVLTDHQTGAIVDSFLQNIHAATVNELRHGNAESDDVKTQMWAR